MYTVHQLSHRGDASEHGSPRGPGMTVSFVLFSWGPRIKVSNPREGKRCTLVLVGRLMHGVRLNQESETVLTSD